MLEIERTFRDREFLFSFFTGIVALLASLASVYYSTRYATESASNAVTDIILSNTRVYDVELLFVYGALTAVVFSILLVLTVKLRAAPYVVKSAALFLFIRSIFVSLTHISPFPHRATLSQFFLSSESLAQMFFTGDDLFFSGHVGLTFLMALVFWETPLLRYIYLTISGVFAVVVLLGHLHYSIDVFAAYFITYTIYCMTLHLFAKDRKRMLRAG
jgi:hypothetical protein